MDYPEVNILIDTVRRLKISVSHGPVLFDVAGLYYRWIEFNISGQVLNMPFMDEYEDANQLNPVVMLNMTLLECEMVEESADFIDWCKESGVIQDHKNALKLHAYLKNAAVEFRKLVGKELSPIPYFDIELNTGKARALRDALAD